MSKMKNSLLFVKIQCSPGIAGNGRELPKHKGIGISSMLAVCNKYDGHLGYSVENGVCSACAVLKLSTND